MSDVRSVVMYLTNEIRELIRLGPVHSLTWVSNIDPGRWMQISVHDGAEHYLTVLCVLPPHISKKNMDKLLGKVGRRQAQVNHGTCLVYYLAQSCDAQSLLEQAGSSAEQCAAIAQLLWNANSVGDFELIGARGPKLPLYDINVPAITAGKQQGVPIPEPSSGARASSSRHDKSDESSRDPKDLLG
jgi:hypothetical protein